MNNSEEVHVPQDILVDRPAPGVVRITLNRPDARNALRTQMLSEIAGVLAAAAADEGTRAVVITGGLRFFAAGADLRERDPLREQRARKHGGRGGSGAGGEEAATQVGCHR